MVSEITDVKTTTEVNEGVKLVEHNGKMYFSDETDKGSYTHEVVILE